jgi:hypothetical protein
MAAYEEKQEIGRINLERIHKEQFVGVGNIWQLINLVAEDYFRDIQKQNNGTD